jgi:hypothetical protein
MKQTFHFMVGMPGRSGGARRGAGRPKGSRDRTTIQHGATLTQMARAFTPEALETLRTIRVDSEAPASARVAACNAILDRGWGRPPQAIDHTSGGEALDLAALGAVERQQLLLAIRLACSVGKGRHG